jgi:pimeloyl-ACP methyl ester carboxylesterase
MNYLNLQYLLLSIAIINQAIASLIETKFQKPPGELIDLGGYKVHLYCQGTGSPTVIIDHSLGGVEGYFLVEEIAEFTRVCIYDRPGYGWSDPSPKPRCSREIVRELNLLLTKANIESPYILVGNSFGSYNVRLYARLFADRVTGMVLSDGLSEKNMGDMPLRLRALKFLFLSGFMISILGSSLGIIRILGILKIFELIKPELDKFDSQNLETVKKSFYYYNHWLTMIRELWNLDKSGRQVAIANRFDNLPIVSIKSRTFFKTRWFNFFLPLKAVDRLRDMMHDNLSRLSNQYTQISAERSSHFVWIDEPELIIAAIKQIITNN